MASEAILGLFAHVMLVQRLQFKVKGLQRLKLGSRFLELLLDLKVGDKVADRLLRDELLELLRRLHQVFD